MNTDEVPAEYCLMWECREMIRCKRKRCVILRESEDMAIAYGIELDGQAACPDTTSRYCSQ